MADRPFARRAFERWSPLLLAVGLVGLRSAFPERSLQALGPAAILDAGFAVGLVVLLLFAARGLGWFVLRLLNPGDIDSLVGLSFAMAAGLGILAYGVLALGLIGWLTPAVISVWIGACTILAIRETTVHGTEWGDPFLPFRRLPPGLKLGMATALAIFVLSLFQALTPVWDYDGLMYHLQGPALFLKAGEIVLLPDLWQANGPLTAEMLYLVGLTGGSEVFSKVIHLSIAGILVGVTFGVARRHLGDRAGWIAGGILLGVPILPVWGSLAYADMAWALFEFLAIAAYLEWRASPRRAWLIVAGAMLGLAMGSKYTALPLLPILLMAVLFDPKAGGTLARFRSALTLAGVCLLVASPWYVKNLLESGNPFYPFLFGGAEWPAERLRMLMTYLQSFGTGRSATDYLLLPVNLLTRRAAFGTFMSRIDIPSPLFLLALGIPLLGRDHPFRPLGWIALLRFAAWTLGTQQTRFLLPLYPVLSLLAAAVIEAWVAYPLAGRWRQTAVTGVIAGMVGVTLAYQAIYLVSTRPIGVVVGSESKDSFLERSVYDYAAVRFIRDELEESDRVFLAWDGQGYYCDARCLPDAEQSQWTQLVARADSPDGVTEILRRRGINYLLVDWEGMSFMLDHDPSGAHAAAAAFLREYAPRCLEPVFEAEKTIVFRLNCG